METWDSIRARRNVREYEDRSIPPEDLERILPVPLLATLPELRVRDPKD